MSCSSSSLPPASVTHLNVTSTTMNQDKKNPYEFEELHQVANYGALLELRSLEVEASKKKAKKILKCDSEMMSATNLMMKLKSLIDEKVPSEQQYYLNLPVGKKSQASKFLECNKHCMCGAYASLIYQIEKLTPEDEALQKSLQQRHEKQTDQELLNCARKASWFCNSKLFSELIQN